MSLLYKFSRHSKDKSEQSIDWIQNYLFSNVKKSCKSASQKVYTVPLGPKIIMKKKIIVQLRILFQTTTPTCFNTVYTCPNFFQFTYHRYYIYKELIISMSNTFIMSPVF